MPYLNYRDPADGQFKVCPILDPTMTHAALSGLAADDHTDHYTPARADTVWYQKAGGGSGNAAPLDTNYMTGTTTVTNYLMLHNPGVSAIIVYPNTGPALRVVNHTDGSTLQPIEVGEALTQTDTLVNWGSCWQNMSDRVSGPHGPRAEWTLGGVGTWVNNTSGGLTYPIMNIPGMFKVQITADLYATNPASAGSMPEAFMSISARWNTGQTPVFNNNLMGGLGRLSVLGNGITELTTATVFAWIPNIIGSQLVVSGAVQMQGQGEGYTGGDYKHTFEFIPFAINDSAKQNGWVAN